VNQATTFSVVRLFIKRHVLDAAYAILFKLVRCNN